MKNLAIAFFLLTFSLPTMATGSRLIVDANAPADFKCVAELEKDSAMFLFLNEAKLYKDGLLLNDHSSSAIEFAWLVYFDEKYIRGDDVYQGFDVGVRYYTKKEEPKQRTLKELFDLSEIHGFAYGEKYFARIYFGNALTAKVIDSDVVLLLRRSPSTAFFFDNPPKYANFWVIANKKQPRKCLAKVK